MWTLAFVTGGEPVTVVEGCAVVPMYGVIVYVVTGLLPAGAVHVTLAAPMSAVALTSVTCPGAPAVVKTTST